ncbi:MAG: DUF1343 domain-containing protein [Candidatus Aminicenantes bacterium]
MTTNTSTDKAWVNKTLHALKRSIPLLMFFCLALFWLQTVSSTIPRIDDSNTQERVILGSERALESFTKTLHGKRLGLVLNHTSLLPDGTPVITAFLKKGIQVQAVFSPEHGFTGQIEAGFDIEDSRIADIPVFSLYGKTKKPTADEMKNIDAFVYDIQDVGTRFYTYITTLMYVLEAAGEAGKSVYVCDRPNPSGGIHVEGPVLKEKYKSFIGACPIPIRYGLTSGELAKMMQGEGWVSQDVALHVIPMDKWCRSYSWDDTGLPWIPTSPNIPTPEAALAFPGTGLLGGLLLNQGLGTPHPFLQFGTPWLDSKALVSALEGNPTSGIELETLTYTPVSLPGKALHPAYENRLCYGIRIHIREPEKFRPVHFTLALIQALKDRHGAKISVKSDSLNLLFGDDLLVRYIQGNLTYDQMIAQIKKEEESFRRKRQQYLLYD